MDEILTIEEMKARYAPEWMLIVEPVVEDGPRLLAGKVIFPSPHREGVYRKAIGLRPGDFAFRFPGEMPEDMEFVL